MSHSLRNFGIIAEYDSKRISIFDTESMSVIQQIRMPADVIDVDLTKDGNLAVISSFYSKTMFQLDLERKPAKVICSAIAPTSLEDVQLTPDDRFAVSVDGSSEAANIVSYSLRKNAFVSILPTTAQAVSVSPNCNGLVLTAERYSNAVHRFKINRKGHLTDTEQKVPVGYPINICFSPDGNFAFVADYANAAAITVLSVIIPDNISVISMVPATSPPQSMAITSDGRHLFVLGMDNVDIFSFDSVSGNLVLQRSFAHGLHFNPYFGVDQIALNSSENRLFISAFGELAVFTTWGTKLGTVSGAEGSGGLAIYKHCSKQSKI